MELLFIIVLTVPVLVLIFTLFIAKSTESEEMSGTVL